MKKVLVYGWYHQLNIGDELFVSVFKKLFPDYTFSFHEFVTIRELEGVDVVFFGGGSFLLDRPNITEEALEALKTKKIFYLGVGVEADIHPTHMELMKHALLIATRTIEQIDRVKCLNPNVEWIPDLAYALQSEVKLSEVRDHHSVLVMPNVSVVPQTFDPHWKHAAWMHFKSEFSQFLDWLVDNGYQPFFLSMCRGTEVDDHWAANEIIAHMARRNRYYLIDRQPVGIERTTEVISKFGFVLTQRFHGIVLSEMTRTPYISIYHHDKLKVTYPGEGKFVSYYNTSKQSLISAFEDTIKMKFSPSLPIESNIFEALGQKIMGLVENGSLCRS